MVKPCHLGKPVSATLVAARNQTQQKGLPSQPVPPLHQTCELYLSMLEPIVEEDELKRTKELVKDFLKAGGVGERLQRGLERRARNTENWVTEDYLKYEFLNKRHSLAVQSNTALVYPRMEFMDKQEQIRCAAKYIVGFLELKTMIINDALPVEYMKGKPLCMKQYEQLISSCRIPGLKEDSLVFYGRSSNPPKHITVVHNNQFFVLDVYNSVGTLLTVDQLCVQLQRICNTSLQTDMEPVGILTSQHRDIWSKTYISLMKDKTNKESLSAIQSSIVTVCLDKAMPPVSDEMYRRCVIPWMLTGGGSQWNSGNRWFDKGLQLIIGEDGICGINYSHACADGVTQMVLGEHVLQNKNQEKPQMMPPLVMPLPMPQKLHFNITPEVKKDIEETKHNMDIMARNLDVRDRVFDHFGGNVLKAGKMSPDAFVQMAVQLAYYRMYRRCSPIIEPVSLRTFRLGRLANMNSTSSASATFVQAFDDPKKQNSEKVDLLEKALKAHKKSTNMTISGQDAYGHLFGLKMQAVEENISMPDLFTDTSFAKAFDFRHFTSQVISKFDCLACIGPEQPSAYLVYYSIKNDHIYLMVSTFEASNTCKETNAVHLIQAMEDALLDMKTLLEQTPRAKL
ncbi:carnitine O-acetyltransferase-like [Micropterus dolomieu]|uniref:carnitine O-acetyltransferase-like n=1 Tax=Micropterus dolomieu TaxID=147949 RepID=UPI001E8D7D29|nr:carnitine O-acetyltransferase-like [Micropterus dolomieu]